MKAQAKKMNVDSLKSNQKDGEASAEVKIAKVAITNVMLWLCTWTPYAIVVAIPVFGNPMLVTPIVSQLPAFLGKNNTYSQSLSSKKLIKQDPSNLDEFKMFHIKCFTYFVQLKHPPASTRSSSLCPIQSSARPWQKKSLAWV